MLCILALFVLRSLLGVATSESPVRLLKGEDREENYYSGSSCEYGSGHWPLLVLNSLAARGASDTVAAITQLENESVKADMANDPSWIKKNLAEDYVGGDSFGNWVTKSETVKDAEDTAKNKTTSESMTDLKVTAYRGAAIARYKETYDRLYHGEHAARSIICTDTWIDQGGTWKQVASHCSQTK